MVDADPVRALAANLASWHDSSVRALGWAPRRDEHWWSCPTPAPNIYHSAIACHAPADAADEAAMLDALRVHLDDPESLAVSVCDPWDRLDLSVLGLTPRARGTNAGRPSGPLPPPERPPADLEVRAVTDAADLAAYEATAVAGFGARFPLGPFDIHARGILADPAMHVFVGFVHGEPVAGAMAYVSDGRLGIYGVTTIAPARRNGYATTLTRAALAVDLARPAVLQPTPAAWPLYERLGFTELGPTVHWA